MSTHPLHHYLREGSLPHFFCAGCGAAQVLNYFLVAVDEIHLNMDSLVAIGGVGCTARIPVYLKADALHGVHGRTLPWATGIKLHNPALKVVVFAGDGDAVSIGGNHLIHTARRNLDVTMIVVNNLTYGMTGGQVGPTTPRALTTSTTPYGSRERPLDICNLAVVAGATFVGRSTAERPRNSISLIKKALQHRGFALAEVVAQCPTGFGRSAIGTTDAIESLRWIKRHTTTRRQSLEADREGLSGEFVTGIFVDKDESVFEGTSVAASEIEE